jgi:dihydrofolate reductase
MLDPVAIGEGVPIFSGIRTSLGLALKHTKIFSSGVVLLYYESV